MHERLKASEVGQIECQTCEKKIYVVKKILGKIFLKFFSWNLILIYILNYFCHFQPFSYYKKCAYLKEVIRRDFDQCLEYFLETSSLHSRPLLLMKTTSCRQRTAALLYITFL